MIANKLREYRERAGLTQVTLARRVGVAATNLCNIEAGRLAAWPRLQRKLARALKTTPAELFPGESANDQK